MKKCDNCSIEFEPKHKTRGSEQKYCSIKCRQSAAQTRMINKIKENEKERITRTERIGTTENMDGNGGGISEINERRGYFTNSDVSINQESRFNDRGNSGYTNYGVQESHINLIKQLYESKSETIFYKLKNEQLEKELNELKIEFHNLEQELESEGEEESGYDGMLGSVIEQYKQDPLNTINFATELIGNLFKPKTNERTVKS
jgi:hypothetical protein